MSSPSDSQSPPSNPSGPSPSISFAPPPDTGRSPPGPEPEHLSVAFVKGGKRKRLSKACDACHKSKRRCDGTAPCSNCYYASKNCTYTDAAGRPVPAPRNLQPERAVSASGATAQQGQPANEPPPWAGQATLARPPGEQQVGVERDPSTKRSRKGPGAPDSSPPLGNKSDVPAPNSSHPLDPALAHELVNIFFAHCNPQRMIIHKPSFIADFGLNKVPHHLLLTVCAVAAPLSKSISSKASHARLAGVPFFQDALSLMFDNSGTLICEPSVSTAQTLCLLEMHEIAASHSWTRQFKYFELAQRVLEGSLQVQVGDSSAPPSPTHTDGVMRFIERECTRRCFWFILTMSWISYIYTHRAVGPRLIELADIVRLPIDETTFELASLSSSATSEFLRRPAPRTRYASQFGHMLRILEIYHKTTWTLSNKEGPARLPAMASLRKDMEEWVASLPSHLQFTEENLDTQITMFETSSNSGAWCFCFMHAMYPCCYLALLEGEGTLSEPIPWVRNQLNMIFNAAGTRAKTSILSACALWSYSAYSSDDPQIHVWDRDFEKIWGFKVVLVAEQWRQSQAQAKEKERAAAAAAAQQQHHQQQQQQQLHHQHHQSQQQQMYLPRDTTKSNSSSPPSAHSSPGMHTNTTYEGRRTENPRALLRTNMSMPDLESVARSHAALPLPIPPAQPAPMGANLPSLKASGLLNLKPPSEAFANSLSLGAQPGGARMSHAHGQGTVAPAAVSNNLNWLVDSGGGRM